MEAHELAEKFRNNTKTEASYQEIVEWCGKNASKLDLLNKDQQYLFEMSTRYLMKIKIGHWNETDANLIINYFAKTFANEYIVYGHEYVTGAIGGILGWLEIDVNLGVIIAYLIILFIAAISEKSEHEFSTKSKIWIFLLIFGISALLKGTMYIAFTPVGNGRICGVQGRYYTPLLFLAIMCLIKKNNNWEIKNLHEKMMVTSTILNICAVITVIQNYL